MHAAIGLFLLHYITSYLKWKRESHFQIHFPLILYSHFQYIKKEKDAPFGEIELAAFMRASGFYLCVYIFFLFIPGLGYCCIIAFVDSALIHHNLKSQKQIIAIKLDYLGIPQLL